MLRYDDVTDGKLYTVTYVPGLFGMRWNASWQDGIARDVPTPIVRDMFGTVNPFCVFPNDVEIEWGLGGVPVAKLPEPQPAPPKPKRKPMKRAEAKPKRGPGRPRKKPVDPDKSDD